MKRVATHPLARRRAHRLFALDGDIDAVVTRAIDETVSRQIVPERGLLVAVNTDPELGAKGANFVRIRRL